MTFLDWVSLRKFFDGLIYQHCGDNKGSGCMTENGAGMALQRLHALNFPAAMSSFQRLLVWSTDGIQEMWHLCVGLISAINTVNILLCLWIPWKENFSLSCRCSVGRGVGHRAAKQCQQGQALATLLPSGKHPAFLHPFYLAWSLLAISKTKGAAKWACKIYHKM